MIYLFIVLVVVGLIAAVRVMLYGVERDRAAGDESPRSFSASPAVIAVFSFVAGIVGYAALRFGLRTTWVVVASLGLGVITALGTSRAIARWWTVVPEHDIDDERYILQGSLARVVAAIESAAAGSVSLESSGHEQVMPARSIDDRAMPAGTEVVIERIEEGVAYVEDWAEVEKRL